MQAKPKMQRPKQSGFTMVEMLIVILIVMVIGAMAIPGYQATVGYLRMSGDGRDINGLIAGAKMQAAAEFTHARAYADLAANTFHMETWNKTANGGVGCWQTVGDIDPATGNPRCTDAAGVGTSPVQPLSQGVTFGTGGVAAPPPNTQALIGQAPLCMNLDGTGGTIPNTACLVFNSRGIPIAGFPPAPNAPFGNDALYITDNNTVYAVTANASGSIQVWAASANAPTGNWYHK
jgi:Tfp pilus assembly protein FimT